MQAWHCYLSFTCKIKPELIQRQCLRIIHPDIEYEDRFIHTGIPVPSDYLEQPCLSYVEKIATSPTLVLHHHIPRRHSTRGHHSARLHNASVGFKNYSITKNRLFSKMSVNFSCTFILDRSIQYFCFNFLFSGHITHVSMFSYLYINCTCT